MPEENRPHGGMRPFGAVMPFEDARRLMLDAARPVDGQEWLDVRLAAGRVLATDVPAPFDVPGFDRSAMDGYAVRSTDLASASAAAPVWLSLAGRARPAAIFPGVVVEGACVDIATGAPLPEGADAVVMVERTRRDADRVAFTQPVAARDHVSRRGNDVAAGVVVLRAGDVLTPARLGVAASFGLASLAVRRAPIVALISSGDELLDATAHQGTPQGIPGPGQIYDANRVMLAAVCEASGATVRALPLVRDAIEHWRLAFDAVAGADLIVCSGGSSVGEQDFGSDILAERGDVIFHGIAVKPGKPTAFARIGAQLVLAMPGNPTSCLSNAYVLLRPLVRQLAGLPPLVTHSCEATIARELKSPVDRLQFYPVRLDGDRAVPVFKGSGEVTSLSDADGYVDVPVGVSVIPAGARVLVTLY